MDSDLEKMGILVDRIEETPCLKCGAAMSVASIEPFVPVQCPECGHPQTVPARLGHFKLLRLLGAGGMGGVYHAHDESLKRDVAIKVMKGALGEDQDFVDRFKREAQAAAKLNHPSIAQIYSVGQEKGQPYIVMELVSGHRFDRMIEPGRSLDQALAMQVGLDIAEGLNAAAEIELIHGDIKPENILLDEKGRAKLVDFGVASFAGQASKDGVWGTPYYIAPEKARRERAGVRSDIYSLGATLYHALAGQPPFEGATSVEVVQARLAAEPRPLREMRSSVDERVERLVARMLRMDPAQRYPTYASLIADIRKVLAELPPPRFAPTLRKSDTARTGASGGRPKIVIRKGTSMSAARLTDYKKILPEGARAGGKPKTREPRRGRRIVTVTLWLLLAAALAGGGYFGWRRWKKKEEAQQAVQREAQERDQFQKAAATAYTEVLRAASNVVAIAGEAAQLAERATNAVQAVTGRPLTFEPAAPEAAASNATETAAEASATGRVETAEGEAAPARTRTRVRPGEEKPAPGEHAIVPLAREIVACAQAVRAKAEEAGTISKEAWEACQQAQDAWKSPLARAKADALAAMRDAVKNLDGEARGAVDEARRTLERIDALRKNDEDKNRAAEAARTEEERRRAEEEARRRQEAEYQALLTNELAKVEGAAVEGQAQLKMHRYSEAAQGFAQMIDTLTTKEAKESLQALASRYKALAELKVFLIERLNADPFQWGWGRGTSGVDVLGADEASVKIRGREVPWAEVDAAQMLKFIRRYVDSPKVSTRVRARQNLAAAVFCHLHAGKEAAARFAEHAVELSPSLRGEAERLVPMK